MFPGHLAPTVPFAARTARHVPLALQLQQPRRVKGAGRWLCSCGRCACFGAVQQHTTAAASVALQRRRLASGRQAGQLQGGPWCSTSRRAMTIGGLIIHKLSCRKRSCLEHTRDG